MNDITILHLSDLHIDVDSSGTYSRLLSSLLNDIKDQILKIPNGTLVIAVTGDTIHQGKKEASTIAVKFFDDLYEIVKDKCSAIYFVPGNHDKKRTEENKFLVPSYRLLRQKPLEPSIVPESQSDKFRGKPFDESFYNLFWPYHLDSYKEEHGSGYYELTQKVYERFKMDPKKDFIEKTFGVDIINIKNKFYAFVMINTSWSCIDDTDNRQLILGKFQLDYIIEEYKKQAGKIHKGKEIELTIVLGHHPLEALYGMEQDALFTELISFEALNANVYLCGHTHDRTVVNWVNNRHSMNTFECGIGWPESNSGHHLKSIHTYSQYIFNLSVNSIDIFVRRSDDNGSFNTDLSIYTNESTRTEKKIVFPIRAQDAQSYMPMGAVEEVSAKACYVSKGMLDGMRNYHDKIGKLYRLFYDMIFQSKKDLENRIIDYLLCEQEHSKKLTEVETLSEEFGEFSRIFYSIDSSNHNSSKQKDAVTKYLNSPAFRILRADNLKFFFQKFVDKFRQIMVDDLLAENDVVRFHFRYLSSMDSMEYKCLVQSLNDYASKEDYAVSDIKFTDLIKESFKLKRPLVYSANVDFCVDKPLKDKWKNFITVIPEMDGNVCRIQSGDYNTINVPLLTFGITSNTNATDDLLYLMDYFRIDKLIGQMLDQFLRSVYLDVEKCIDLVC